MSYTTSQARSRIKEVLDDASEGLPSVITRGGDEFLVLHADVARPLLAAASPRPEVVAEDDGWSVVLSGAPVAADGRTLAEAVQSFIGMVRDYSDDWLHDEALRGAPNHRQNAPLVQLVDGMDDDDLRRWVTGEPAAPPR